MRKQSEKRYTYRTPTPFDPKNPFSDAICYNTDTQEFKTGFKGKSLPSAWRFAHTDAQLGGYPDVIQTLMLSCDKDELYPHPRTKKAKS